MKPSERCAKAMLDPGRPVVLVGEDMYADFIARETNCDELLKALRNMVREWKEIVGDVHENSTPADTLEKAIELIEKANR